MYRTATKCFVVLSLQWNVVTPSCVSKLTRLVAYNGVSLNQTSLHKQQLTANFSNRPKQITNFVTKATNTMGKPTAEGQKQQLRMIRIREKRQKHGNPLNERTSPTSLQIIGDGTKGNPASVLLIAGNHRMLFNCGEGIQRMLLENGIRSLSRTEHILFTRLTWDNVGGAIGMAIGLKSVGLPQLNFHGPKNMEQFVDAFQIFAKKDALDIVTTPYTMGDIETEAVHIKPVPLFARGATPSASLSSTSSESAESSQSDSETEEKTNKRKAKFNKAPKLRKTTADISIAYICKLYSKPGKLRMDKIKELGVKPHGPHLTQLKLGNSYTMENGTVVHPDQVLGQSEPALYFIVLECPSEEYIESITTSSDIARHHDGNGSDIAKIVIHMCPQEVINHEVYRTWMEKFGSATEHVVLNETNASITHLAVRRMQTKLNLLHDSIFPTLPFTIETDGKGSKNDDSLRICHADSFQQFHMRPDNGWTSELVQSVSTEPFLQEVKELSSEFETSLNNLKNSLETLGCNLGNTYPEIVFTGTGSAVPNKDRNVTGILLNISGTQSMILDCGDGTYGQLHRFYGRHRIDDVIAKLHCVFVSHIHADHHSGLIKLIQEWNRIMENRGEKSRRLILVGPALLNTWLKKYDAYCESIMDKIRFIDLRNLSEAAVFTSDYQDELLHSLDLIKFETVPVLHCSNSHAVVLSHKCGWRIAYSGDCMPSNRLVQAGQNADLLIHEATLEDGMKEEAAHKRHSMLSEAIDIGVQMKAKFTLLTHFSQRYMKIPMIKSELSGQVGIAFDNMRVSLSELPILPKFLPVLHQLFAEDIEEMEKKRSKKEEKAFLLGEEHQVSEKEKKKASIQDSDETSTKSEISGTSMQDTMSR